jgi:hypothetical protein
MGSTMSGTNLLAGRMSLRGVDTNSLLRILDQARATRLGEGTQFEKVRALRTYDRVSDELRRRGESVRL